MAFACYVGGRVTATRTLWVAGVSIWRRSVGAAYPNLVPVVLRAFHQAAAGGDDGMKEVLGLLCFMWIRVPCPMEMAAVM